MALLGRDLATWVHVLHSGRRLGEKLIIFPRSSLSSLRVLYSMLYTMEGINSSTPQNNVKETDTEAEPPPVRVEEDAQLTSYPLLDLVLRRLTNV